MSDKKAAEQVHVALDVETTGLNTSTDRIRSLSAVFGTQSYGIIHRLSFILDGEGQPSGPEALAIHRIPDHVAGALPQRLALQLLDELTKNTTVVIHHKAFDAPMLLAAYQRHKLPTPNFLQHPATIIDTMDIGKTHYPGKATSLESLSRLSGICPSLLKMRAERHDSLDDATLCFELWRAHSTRATLDLQTAMPPTKPDGDRLTSINAGSGLDWL